MNPTQIGFVWTAVTSTTPSARSAIAARASLENKISRITCRCSICRFTINSPTPTQGARPKNWPRWRGSLVRGRCRARAAMSRISTILEAWIGTIRKLRTPLSFSWKTRGKDSTTPQKSPSSKVSSPKRQERRSSHSKNQRASWLTLILPLFESVMVIIIKMEEILRLNLYKNEYCASK